MAADHSARIRNPIQRKQRGPAERRAPRAGARFKRKVWQAGPAGASPFRTPMESLRLRDELQRLDAAWEVERERYRVNGELPSSGRVWANLAAVILVLYVLAYGEPEEGVSDAQVTWFAWAVVTWMVFAGTNFYVKASDYDQAHKAYLRRRAELLAGDLELSEDWQGMMGADWIPGQPSIDP